MIRIELQIDFVRIIYQQPTKLPSSIVLSLHNEDGSCANEITKSISAGQQVIQLSSLPSFHLFMVAKQQNETYSPFSMLFTTNGESTTKRKLPLHKGQIFDHFQKIDTMASPLELVYSFHEGQLVYNVTVLKAAKVIHDMEIQRFENNFISRVEMYSTRESLPEMDMEKSDSKLFISKADSRLARRERRKIRNRQINEDEDHFTSDGLHHSKMTEDTHHTVDEDFEGHAFLSPEKTNKEEVTYAPGFKAKVIKRPAFGGQPIPEEEQQQKGISLKIKLVIYLLLLGLVSLFISFMDEQSAPKTLPKSPKVHKESKVAKVSKVSKETKTKGEHRKRKVK